MIERERLEQAIAALETQRTALGDDVVDTAIAALREKLERLESAPPSDRRQRKQITVLFGDVPGFTSLTETMDPEQVNELMNALWTRLDKIITDCGGRIDKHMGDGIMALWGVESAREDDPEQAIRAALAMQDILEQGPGDPGFRDPSGHRAVQVSRQMVPRDAQPKLAMRIGIHTGPVLLGVVGTTGEYTAMGDTVNLAARLEQAAPVGGILISHATYRHTRGIFDVQTLDAIAVKGKAAPVQVYLVQQARPHAFRRGTRGVEGIETRMIGRMAELWQLQEAFHAVTNPAGGKRQILTIIGDAGIGKSRLLHEFEKWIEGLSIPVLYFKGRASLETHTRPYALIRDLFAFHFQIQDSDQAETMRQKVEIGVGQVLGMDEGGQMRAHLIGQLLGFDFDTSPHVRDLVGDAQQLRDRSLIYLREFFQTTAQRAPVIIFLEDIHWADDSSLDVIDYVARTMLDQRVLIVCLTRPTLAERRPYWGVEWPGHIRLGLQPLSRQDSHHLVDEILQRAQDVPVTLRDMVVSGAEGNPFYVEELIKMLIEDGIIVTGEEHWHVEPTRLITVRVPSTLTGVLQARLDNLPLEEQVILQQAAVVGRTFWDSAVAHINASVQEDGDKQVAVALTALGNREIVFPRQDSAFAGTQEYIFKHAILREVTYESVLKRVRCIYHALVAEWLIEHSGDRAGEYAGLIADHLELAGEIERAVVYLRQAGEQAVARFANAEAVVYLSRALDLTPEADTAARYGLLLARERIYDVQGHRDSQVQNLTILEQLADTLDDDRKRAEVGLRQAHYAHVTGDYPAAIAAIQAAIDLAQASQAVDLEATGHLQWGLAFWRQGNYEAARAQLKHALTRARAAGLRRVEASSLLNLGRVSAQQGDYTGARVYHEQALHIYREIGDRQGVGMSLNSLGYDFFYQGDYARAKTYFEQSRHICREMGDRRSESRSLNNLGEVCRLLGDYAGARVYDEQALHIDREIGDRRGEALRLVNLGLVSHQLGDNDAACGYAQQALTIAQDLGDRPCQAYALTFLGHALVDLGQLTKATAAYQQALTLRQELDQPHLAMEILAGLARVYLAQGDLGRAGAHVETILGYLESNSLDGTEEPLRVYLTCHQVMQTAQDPGARAVLTTAHALLQDRAARITDPELRSSFLENVVAHRAIVRAFAL